MLVTELTQKERRQPPELVIELTRRERRQQLEYMNYVKTAAAKLKWYKKYCWKHRGRICAYRRGRYALAEPKPVAKEFYVKELQQLLLKDTEARVQLLKGYKQQYKSACSKATASGDDQSCVYNSS